MKIVTKKRVIQGIRHREIVKTPKIMHGSDEYYRDLPYLSLNGYLNVNESIPYVILNSCRYTEAVWQTEILPALKKAKERFDECEKQRLAEEWQGEETFVI